MILVPRRPEGEGPGVCDRYEMRKRRFCVSSHAFCFRPPEKPIMRMLDARVGDKEAQEFVRRLKEIEKSMEEE